MHAIIQKEGSPSCVVWIKYTTLLKKNMNEAIRYHKSKDRQYSGQKKRNKHITENQIMGKTNSIIAGDELSIHSSCSINVSRRVTLVSRQLSEAPSPPNIQQFARSGTCI